MHVYIHEMGHSAFPLPRNPCGCLQVKAQRRAGPAQPEKLLKGDVQDDVVSKKSTSAGVNPFKKETVVSKFDVNDIRKVEFIGSYVDDESAWPKVMVPT